MGFFDHLEDLRWTLVKCAVVFVAFACLIGFEMKEFNDVLLWPLRVVQAQHSALSLDLGTTSMMEVFSVMIQMCGLGGLVMAGPFILFFVGQFVAPALTEKEVKMVLPTTISALVLFLLGASFSFFLLVPSTLRVAVELNEMFGYVMRWTPGSYYSLLMWLVLGVGASFEFPLLIVIAVQIGFLRVAQLRAWRKIAIVVFFIVAAVITPTPDPINQTIFVIPLLLLYEIAIIAGARVEKRKAMAEVV